MPQKDKIAFSGTLSAAEDAQYLESLARGIRERSMLLESGDASISLQVPEDLKLEIEVESDASKGKSAIEVHMSWRLRPAEEERPPAGLLIVPGAPVEAPSYAD